MEKVTEISNEAIENMDMALALSILADVRCRGLACDECLCQHDKHSEYECSITRAIASEYLSEHLDEIHLKTEASPIESPKEEISIPTPEDTLPYEGIRSFMKDRGYARCYMCGASLKEGSKDV